MIPSMIVRLFPVKRNVYWQSERLIPEGGIVKELRKAAIQETYQLTGQYAKDSDEVKHLLNESIVQSINKELRKEKKTQS